MTRPGFWLRLAAACLPVACGEIDSEPPVRLDGLRETVEGRVDDAAADASSASRVVLESDPFLGTVGAREPAAVPLPARVEGPDGFSWTTGVPVSPGEIAARIADATGLPVALDLQFPETLDRVRSDAPALRYRGPLSGFLSLLGRRWGAGWTYEGGVVTILDRLYRTYAVRASVAQSSLSLETADSATDAGSLSTGVKLESAAWQEIDSNLAGIVTPGTYTLSPGAGFVGVAAPPDVHRAVAAYLDRANRVFDTRIAIEVAAAFLDVSDIDDVGLSLNLLSTLLDGRVELELGRETLSRSPGVASVRIPDSATGGLARHAGTTSMLRALARTNRVIDYRTANAITRHGSPVPIRLSRRQDIVRRVAVTLNGDASTTSIESETLDTGLSITVHPRLADAGKVHLTLSVSASDLVSLVPFQSGDDSSVQLATVDERRLTHDFVIEDDELAILAGYEQRRAGILGEGVGTPGFMLLGGSRSGEALRSRLYLFVSARIIR